MDKTSIFINAGPLEHRDWKKTRIVNIFHILHPEMSNGDKYSRAIQAETFIIYRLTKTIPLFWLTKVKSITFPEQNVSKTTPLRAVHTRVVNWGKYFLPYGGMISATFLTASLISLIFMYSTWLGSTIESKTEGLRSFFESGGSDRWHKVGVGGGG